MATHSSTLAWRIPWTEEPGRLQSMGSHRVGHDWSDLAAAAVGRGKWELHQPNLVRTQGGILKVNCCLVCKESRRLTHEAGTRELSKPMAILCPLLKTTLYICVLCRVQLRDPMDCIAHQAPLSMKFSEQKYRGVGCHFLLGIFPTQGLNHISCVSSTGRRVLYPWATWEAPCCFSFVITVTTWSEIFSSSWKTTPQRKTADNKKASSKKVYF